MTRPYYAAHSITPLTSIGYLIKRCGSMMAAIAEEAFQGQKITFTQWVVMMSLRAHDSHLSPTHLSQEAGYDMGALTRVVDALERQGYVSRERCNHDRRAVEITLTSAGARQTEACKGLIVDLLNELIEPFSKKEIDLLIPLLQRLYQRLQECVDAPREKVEVIKRRKVPKRVETRASR
jgi:DNA-binding MarR family transcriptional regulator